MDQSRTGRGERLWMSVFFGVLLLCLSFLSLLAFLVVSGTLTLWHVLMAEIIVLILLVWQIIEVING